MNTNDLKVFRILDVLIDHKQPLDQFFHRQDGSLVSAFIRHFNRKPPVSKLKAMDALFRAMFDWEWIFLEEDASPFDVPEPDKIKLPSSDEDWPRWRTLCCRNRGNTTLVGITAKGGEAWEQMANPYWELYCNQSEDVCGSRHPVVIREFGSRAIALHYLTVDRFRLQIARESTIRVEELAPWQATYWKLLSGGTRISYELEFHDSSRTNYRDITIDNYSEVPERFPLGWYTDPETSEQMV